MKRLHRVQIMLVAIAVGACGDGEPVSIGDDRVESIGEKLSDYAGRWEGYAEAHRFDDGTDTIVLELDDEGNGVLEVGDAEPFPAPEVDRQYPPKPFGEWYDWLDNWKPQLVSGFSYPVSEAQVASRRLRIATSTSELVREWCELQTPHIVPNWKTVSGDPGYLCQPWSGYTYDAVSEHCTIDLRVACGFDGDACWARNPRMEIDCGQVACLNQCKCDENRCGIDTSADVELDAALQADGDQLRGSLLVAGELLNIQLTRLPRGEQAGGGR